MLRAAAPNETPLAARYGIDARDVSNRQRSLYAVPAPGLAGIPADSACGIDFAMSGFRMVCRSLRCLLPLLALLVWMAGSAQAAECGQIFAAGRPPTLLNPRMAARTTFLCNAAYAALASGVTRGPLWSAEHLTAPALTQAHATAREGHFHEDERLPPADRATLADYVRSGYDRGHMTPSGDMSNLAAQQESFSLANVVPQTPKLNRGVWEGIERAVRRLAQDEGELYVVTGPTFQGQNLQSLYGHVLVPTATWKAVYDPIARGGAAYICTNVIRPRCNTLSLAALAQVTGVDPFPAVPNVIKRTAMRLPVPDASRYSSSGRHGHHRRSQFSLFDRLSNITGGWP